MDRKYAFIDESGAYGWDLDNNSVSRFFILSAIIIEQQNLEGLRKKVISLQEKYFSGSELKSNKIGKDHKRRTKFITEISSFPIKIFSLVYDKRKLKDYPGLQFKTSFYKFLNQSIYSTLLQSFPVITITGDSVGDTDFMESFLKYLRNRCGPVDLFNESSLMVQDSRKEPLIQIADIVSGTLAYEFDERKNKPAEYDYLKILENNIIRIDFLPVSYSNFNIETSSTAATYNKTIASICFNKAKIFLEENENNPDEDVQSQVLVLKYLLFRFMNNNQRNYIPTKELINYLKATNIETISLQRFRNRIIGKLRDSNVIIASSNGGYKIPTCVKDLNDFISHDNAILIPMISRLKRCTDIIKLGTNGNLDLLKQDGCEKLQSIISAISNDKN